ncbi:RNA ligase 1 [Ochrobactrum phage vB_OspM_OC]|nr:RNA ligase 1 [Ochrobactrum phage vB_OspM_OC]
MNYQFPVINDISQLLPLVENNENFTVAKNAGWFTKVFYNILGDLGTPGSIENALLRECRGITFDGETGEILARPPHKFYNVNEKEETQLSVIPHVGFELMEKLDGSMIHPIFNKEYKAFRLATKKGVTETAMMAERYMVDHLGYIRLFHEMQRQGYTPYFEFIHPHNRIVLDYKDRHGLVLLGVRNIVSGEYVPYSDVVNIGKSFNVEVVKLEDKGTLPEIIKELETTTHTEGYIALYPDGHKIKLKTPWYFIQNKIFDGIKFDFHIAELVLNGHSDDAKANLPVHAERIERVENLVRDFILAVRTNAKKKMESLGDVTPKEVATIHSKKFTGFERSIALDILNGKDPERTIQWIMYNQYCKGQTFFRNLVNDARKEYGIIYNKFQ